MSSRILKEIAEERENQDMVWGQQDHSPIEWLPILAEEFGEVAKAICEIQQENSDLENYRQELIQTAAVCVAMIESLDRNYL